MVGLTACVAPQTQEQYVAQVRVEDSEFDSAVTYLGPEIRAESSDFPSISGYARLRSFKVKASGRLTHQLYVTLYYSDSKYKRFTSASFPGGANVSVTRIAHERISCDRDAILWPCNFTETIGIELPHGYLLDHTQSGIRVRLDARSGDELLVAIPAHFVSGQLEAMGAL